MENKLFYLNLSELEILLRAAYKEVTTVIAGKIFLKPAYEVAQIKGCDDIKRNFINRKSESKEQEPFNIHRIFCLWSLAFLTIVNIGYKATEGKGGEGDGKFQATANKKIVPFFSRQPATEKIRVTQKSPKKQPISPQRFVDWKSLKRK